MEAAVLVLQRTRHIAPSLLTAPYWCCCHLGDLIPNLWVANDLRCYAPHRSELKKGRKDFDLHNSSQSTTRTARKCDGGLHRRITCRGAPEGDDSRVIDARKVY